MRKNCGRILIIVVISALFAALSACAGGDDKPKQLPAPKGLTVSGSIVTWEEMLEADKFTVSVNGSEYDAEEPSFDIVKFIADNDKWDITDYDVKVKAIGDGKIYTDSEWTDTVSVNAPKMIFKALDNSECALVKCEGARGKLTLPEVMGDRLVTEIGAEAFVASKELTEIVLPYNVTKIGDRAFKGCDKLESAELPQCLTEISLDMFRGCKSLTNIVIPEKVERIQSAFDNCEKLEKINIPKNCRSINPSGFRGCIGLRQITVDAESEYYKGDGNCVVSKKRNILVVGCATSVIPEYVTEIERNAFEGKGLTEFTVPKNVKRINTYAFSHNYSFKTLILENGVEEIGAYAFMRCDLGSVTIPKSIKTIGYAAFAYGNESIEFTVDAENEVYASDGNCIVDKVNKALVIGCNNSVIPEYVTELGDNAFYGCTTLTGILKIPKSITKIGKYCFYDCVDLDGVALSDNVESIGQNAFTYKLEAYGFIDFCTVTVSPETDVSSSPSNILIDRVYKCDIGYDDGYVYAISLLYGKNMYDKIIDSFGKTRGYPTRLGYTLGGFSATLGGEAITTEEQLNAIPEEDGKVRVYPIWIPEE